MCISCYAAMERGKGLEEFSYNAKDLGPRQVKISITHCGVCHSDVSLIDDEWGISRYPLVPGHEIVGTVKEVGADVSKLSIGQRVGVGGQCGACHECEHCVKGDDVFCTSPVYTAAHCYGGFATEISVDSGFAFPIPDSISSEVAAPLLCAGVTTFTPLKRHVNGNMSVGVIGIGGLGHVALQYAKAFGCEVTAFSTSADKKTEVRELGADYFVDSRDPEQMAAAAGTLDYILSTACADLTWGDYLNALKPYGTICVLGLGEAIEIPPVPLVFGQKTITASLIGNREDFKDMLEFSARHNIAPKVEVVPMSKADEAIKTVRSSRLGHRIVLAN